MNELAAAREWPPVLDHVFMIPAGDGKPAGGLRIRVTSSEPVDIPAGLAWDLRDVIRRHAPGGDLWPTQPTRTSP